MSMKPPVLVRSVEDVTQAALEAISTNNWSALYGLLDDDFKKTNSEREFTAKLTSEGYTKFFDAEIAGPTAEDHIFGSTLTTVPLRLRAHASEGSMQTYTSTLQLVNGQIVGLKTPVLASQCECA